MPRDANEIFRQKFGEKLDAAVVKAMPLALAGDFDAAEQPIREVDTMTTMKILLILLALFLVGIAAVAYWLNRVITVTRETPYGPFVVRSEAQTGKTFNINYGMVDQTVVRYSIWFEGKSVAFPGSLQTNTGLPCLWKVYALADAAEPTLLAGSQSLYLIYLKEGKPVVEPPPYPFSGSRFVRTVPPFVVTRLRVPQFRTRSLVHYGHQRILRN